MRGLLVGKLLRMASKEEVRRPKPFKSRDRDTSNSREDAQLPEATPGAPAATSDPTPSAGGSCAGTPPPPASLRRFRACRRSRCGRRPCGTGWGCRASPPWHAASALRRGRRSSCPIPDAPGAHPAADPAAMRGRRGPCWKGALPARLPGSRRRNGPCAAEAPRNPATSGHGSGIMRSVVRKEGGRARSGPPPWCESAHAPPRSRETGLPDVLAGPT